MTHEDFYKWLDECPVQWFRDEITDDQVSYTFILPEDDDDV